MYKLSKHSKKHLIGVHPTIKEIIKRALARSENDFGIPEYGGRRTPQEQNNLFHRIPKVTNVDGFRKKSYHQPASDGYGRAFDVFMINEEGKACWNDCEELYKRFDDLVKQIFEEMKEEGLINPEATIEWGGNWGHHWKTSKDLPHHEIHNLK